MEPIVHPYIPNLAPDSKAAMLNAVGAESVEEFYAEIPGELRVLGDLDLPPAILAEEDLKRFIQTKLKANDSDRLMFLGQGTYPHSTPAVVDEIINRSEFLTAYAGEPYEDHGRFQALFEYQSLMAELLSCDVVTVPTYDGYQATATSLAIAHRLSGKKRVILVSDVLPDKFSRVHDFIRPFMDIELVSPKDAVADLEKIAEVLSDDVAAIWVESPSAIGAVEPAVKRLAELAHSVGALLIVSTEPIMAGVIEPPSVHGADITCGDIQSLGLGQWFGGAHGGFIAMADDPDLIMELPSRIFGIAATAVEGEYGFGDVAYDRTSFALREEGKEWVGTAAALWGIGAAVYLSLMGPKGMSDLAETVFEKTIYLQKAIGALDGFSLTDSALHFREFRIRTEMSATRIVELARIQGIEPGVALDENHLCICVTEMHSLEDIQRLVTCLREMKDM